MNLTDGMIAYTPAWIGEIDPSQAATAGLIAVVPWPDRHRLSDEFSWTFGACDAATHKLGVPERERWLLQAFHGAVVGGGLDPVRVHLALAAFGEYANALVPQARDSILTTANMRFGERRYSGKETFATVRAAEVEAQVQEYLARGGGSERTVVALRASALSSAFEETAEEWRA